MGRILDGWCVSIAAEILLSEHGHDTAYKMVVKMKRDMRCRNSEEEKIASFNYGCKTLLRTIFP